ncbi:hypothetical protein [Peribacillus frigoritolerans]|uniref:hypothetical protein n=1 Tax=Peribacillus frigoritolerans TaxID=450367 RepID=UPI0021AA5349|nr:hypothetical protein [Peribacillus frigoritolerans]
MHKLVSFFIGRSVEKAFRSCELIRHIMCNIVALYFYNMEVETFQYDAGRYLRK